MSDDTMIAQVLNVIDSTLNKLSKDIQGVGGQLTNLNEGSDNIRKEIAVQTMSVVDRLSGILHHIEKNNEKLDRLTTEIETQGHSLTVAVLDLAAMLDNKLQNVVEVAITAKEAVKPKEPTHEDMPPAQNDYPTGESIVD